jgi:hypothetical protein
LSAGAVEQHGAALQLQHAAGVHDETVEPQPGFGAESDLGGGAQQKCQAGLYPRTDEIDLATSGRRADVLSANPSPVTVSTNPAAAAAPKLAAGARQAVAAPNSARRFRNIRSRASIVSSFPSEAA